MARMVADNYTIINPQGIRFVEKIDRAAYASMSQAYRLRVTYKGQHLDYDYKSEAERDAQYQRLRDALAPAAVPQADKE